jgi:hypothetical protein
VDTAPAGFYAGQVKKVGRAAGSHLGGAAEAGFGYAASPSAVGGARKRKFSEDAAEAAASRVDEWDGEGHSPKEEEKNKKKKKSLLVWQVHRHEDAGLD